MDEITIYSVVCSICKNAVESSELYGIDKIFPKAGSCSSCGVICWSCAKMFRPSGPQQTAELRGMANALSLIALTDPDGNNMAPCCPTCDIYLEPITHAYKRSSIVKKKKQVKEQQKGQKIHQKAVITANDNLLFEACKKGNLEEAKILLERRKFLLFDINPKANINAINEDGRSPLFIAIQYGHDHIVDYLITKEPNLNILDKNNKGLLAWATFFNKNYIVELLIKNGADVNAVDNLGETPLHRANDIYIADILLENGASVNTVDSIGMTPLHQQGSLQIANLLIAKGANVNAIDKTGCSPLHYARTLSIVNFLISKGADVNVADVQGNTLLHKVEDVQIAETLIANGAKIEAKNNNGETPLAFAARSRQIKIIEILIAKGANIKAMGDYRLYLQRYVKGL
jgi:ankyrin repeat protein